MNQLKKRVEEIKNQMTEDQIARTERQVKLSKRLGSELINLISTYKDMDITTESVIITLLHFMLTMCCEDGEELMQKADLIMKVLEASGVHVIMDQGEINGSSAEEISKKVKEAIDRMEELVANKTIH